MPKKLIDYSKTVIYKLVCNDLNIKDCYVGHTTDLIRRKRQHKFCCINENSEKYNLYIYKFIRDNGGWNNWSLIEIEKFPCIDSNEARKRERYWIEQLNSNLNIFIPSRNQKEYYLENKETLTKKKKEYYNKNKDKLYEKQKEYNGQNKEKIIQYQKEYHQNNKDKINKKQKEYNDLNKEKIIQYQKEYRKLNKDKIKEKQKEYYYKKIDKIREKQKEYGKNICFCECGNQYTKYSKSSHIKSKKHLKYIQSLNCDGCSM